MKRPEERSNFRGGEAEETRSGYRENQEPVNTVVGCGGMGHVPEPCDQVRSRSSSWTVPLSSVTFTRASWGRQEGYTGCGLSIFLPPRWLSSGKRVPIWT